MDEQRARTIFETVRRSWFLEPEELLRSTPGELAFELATYPVDGVSISSLLEAVAQVRINGSWAE